MNLLIKKNYESSKLPTRANPSDAGLDVYAHSFKIVGENLGENTDLWKRIDYIEYDCGISIQPVGDLINFTVKGAVYNQYFTYLAPRSSISKTNLVQANSYGLIDAGYSGPLLIRYKYIPQPVDFVFYDAQKWPNFGIVIDMERIYKVGDKIGQLIVTQQEEVKCIEVTELGETDRGDKGFGSSGVI